MQISFFATLIAIGAYIIVSLLTCKKDFNMDRMLHRGAYAQVDPLAESLGRTELKPSKTSSWGKVIGIDEDFALWDKWIAAGLFWWSALWSLVMIVGSVWNLISPWPLVLWTTFWHIAGVGIPVLMAFIGAIWFTWGGILDIRTLFQRLDQAQVNHLDNGTVTGHQNLDEVPSTNISTSNKAPDIRQEK
jgi:SSS family solute:Na+ symporter